MFKCLVLTMCVSVFLLTMQNRVVDAPVGADDHHGPHPIDPKLFDASGSDLRTIVKSVTVQASAQRVFDAWATAAGWGEVFPEPSKARIDLAIGGRYEWLFDGETGSNGCQVLSYIPGRMISFTWNAPPSITETRDRRSWVVVQIDPIDEKSCTLRLTHVGFGEGEAWDKTYAYFDQAWEGVLRYMASKVVNE